MTTRKTPGTRNTTVLRRIGQILTAMAIVAGLTVATAGTALAHGVGDLACNYIVGRFNACLQITDVGPGQYKVHVGIDVTMSQHDAQNIIDSPGQEFTFTLKGDDGPSNERQHLASLPVTWVGAWSGGLSAESDVFVTESMLDEDDGTDEIIAVIRLYIPVTGTTRTFETGTVTANF